MSLPSYIAHYTTEQGLQGILTSKKLWATHHYFLNDYTEMKLGMEITSTIFHDALASMEDAEKLKRFIAQEESGFLQKFWLSGFLPKVNPRIEELEIFTTSFSEYTDNDGLLSQWRSYANHGGFAIVFSSQELKDSYAFHSKKCKEHPGLTQVENCEDCLEVIHTHLLLPIQYHKDVGRLKREGYQEAYEAIEDFAPILIKTIEEPDLCKTISPEDTKLFMNGILAFMTTIKHQGFQEEKELRFACLNRIEKPEGGYHFESPYKSSIEGGIPRLMIDFLPKTIKKIIIGPQERQDQKEILIRYLLESHQYENVEIVRSTIPYRKQ